MSKQHKIDWRKQAETRLKAANYERGGKKEPLLYLLMPEIHKVIEYEKDDSKKLLFLTLWFTGAKLTTVLSLSPSSFKVIRGGVEITISKKQKIPVFDDTYRKLIMGFLQLNRKPQNDAMWPVTRQTVNRWHRTLMTVVYSKPVYKPFKPFDVKDNRGNITNYAVTLATYRHSFAMNWLIHSAPVHLLVDIMGYAYPDGVAHYVSYLDYDQEQYFKTVAFR